MAQTHRSGAPRHPRSMIAFCTVLLLLMQTSLWYLSQRVHMPLNWFPVRFWLVSHGWYGLAPNLWTVGTPISYLLICGIGAYYATGGLGPMRARRKGALVGTIGGISGVVLATLILAVLLFWFLQTTRAQIDAECTLHPGPWCGLGFGWTVEIIFSQTVLPFLAINLFGLALAPLGGMLGGHFRAGRSRGDRPAQEWPGEEARARTWSRGVLVVVIIAVLLATLLGVSFILVTLQF